MPDPNEEPEWKPPEDPTLAEMVRAYLGQQGAGQEAEWRRKAADYIKSRPRQHEWSYWEQDWRFVFLVDFQRWLAEQAAQAGPHLERRRI